MGGPSPIVEMRGISVTFPGVKALDEVDFRLFPGEVHSLLGENGAGKSTLIKALTGVYQIDAGTIVIDGEVRRLHGTSEAQAAGIATVYQEVNLCPNLTVGENVMLGHEVRGRFGIDWRATHRAAKAALAKLGLKDVDPRQPLAHLSLGMQQLVAISRAMVVDAKVLILDEPTSSLDSAEVDALFSVVRRLRSEGVAILFVSHFLDQVFALSDRVTVLRNGRFEGEYLRHDLDRQTLVRKMLGKDLDAIRSLDAGQPVKPPDRPNGPLVSAAGLGRAGSLESADLDVHRGEVVGFAGLLGSGRTELARLLSGVDRPDRGQVRIDGRPARLHSPVDGLDHGIAYSTENRRDEGIVADLTVRENLILAVQARRGWSRPLSRREQDDIVRRYLTALNVRPADPEQPIKYLSGGNQQKVLLARWLALDPRLLILDEPTRGIDVGAKVEVQEEVTRLAARGVSVVFISSEIDEVVRLSHRVVVLKDRRKIGEFVNGPHLTAGRIVELIAAHDGGPGGGPGHGSGGRAAS